jgi:hypothetical protein
MDDTSYITQTAYLVVSDFLKSPMTGNCNQQSSPMKHTKQLPCITKNLDNGMKKSTDNGIAKCSNKTECLITTQEPIVLCSCHEE